MGGPTSRVTEVIARWAAEAAAAAADGEVCEENLIALLGDEFERARAWELAQASYNVMLSRLKGAADTPLVLTLVVPLEPSKELQTTPPDLAQTAREVDGITPPSLVVYTPTYRRVWRPGEVYRRALPAVFMDDEGAALAESLYSTYRTVPETDVDEPYWRQLLFERVQT